MAAIVNAAHCSVQPADGAWLVTKTGGTAGQYDASAVSAESMAGDFVLRARTLNAGVAFIGVSPNPAAGHGFETIRWAVQLGGGLLRFHENGVYRSPGFGSNGFVWLRRQGTTLDCLVGPELAGAVVRRSFANVSESLHFASSLEAPGLTVEVKFDGPAAKAKSRRQRLSLGLAF